MKPGTVLDEIEGKETVSFIEAERGLLAALLQAARDQSDTDPSPLQDAFGTELDWSRIDRTVRAEFKDMVYKFRDESGELDREALRDAIDEMASRVGLDDWEQTVREEYKDRIERILGKCGSKAKKGII